MSAKEALISTFSRLKQSKINKIPIIIETKHTSIKSLIAVLEANKPIIVVKKYKNSYAVRVSTTVSSIEVLPQFVHTKNNQLQDWAKKMLAEKSGCLVDKQRHHVAPRGNIKASWRTNLRICVLNGSTEQHQGVIR